MSETLTTPPVHLAAWAGTPEHPAPAPAPFALAAEHPGPPLAAPVTRAPRRALSVTSLVLGGIGVVGCWIPVVNTSSVAFGVGGLGLGIPALVLARRGRQGARGLAVTGVVLSAVTVVVAVVANVLFGLAVAASAESTSAPSGQAAQPLPAASASGSVLGLGSPAAVGDYAVTVVGVELDADGLMAMEDPAAGPAAGQYVLASLDVTYHGAEGGDAWTDLSTAFLGADGAAYDELDCAAVPADSPTHLPALATGGSASYSLCFDVPADVVAGGRVVVHEEGAVAAEPVAWSAG